MIFMGGEVELNIVVLPDAKTRDSAIETSRGLAQRTRTDFILDGRTRHPHMTLYQARFPERNVEKVAAAVRMIAEKNSPFDVSLSKFSSHEGMVWWNSDATSEVVHLHKSVIYQTNPLREDLTLSAFKGRKLDMEQTYNLQNYGYTLVNGLFQPHITVSHISGASDAARTVASMNPRVARFVASRLALGRLGEFGTLTEVIGEFPLGGGKAGSSPYILKSENYF